MGYEVTAEVFKRSAQKGGKLLILLALAEGAENEDGVVFGIDQGWPRSERNVRKQRKTIAGKARLNPATVSRLLGELAGPADDELEIRWVQDGQARTAVYRILVGRYRARDVDYDRLERYRQAVDRPFSTPNELLREWVKRPGNRHPAAQELPDEMQGSSGDGRSGDHLTKDQVPPDISSGDHLASTSDDTSYTRARGSKTTVLPVLKQQQVKPPPCIPSPAAGEDRDDLGDPAAARPPSWFEISEVVHSLRGADAGSDVPVRALALTMSRQTFMDVVETVQDRCRSGRVANPCGLLVSLLKVKHAEQAELLQRKFYEQLGEPRVIVPSPGTAGELVRWAPDLYVRRLARHLDDHELETALDSLHHERLPELLALAARVRTGEESAGEPETPEQARARWVTDRAHDTDFPLSEIQEVVEAWDDVDDVERQELLDQAERIRTRRGRASEEAA